MDKQWIVYAICVLIGIFIDAVAVRLQKSYGVLRIDHSNPEKDVFRIEIDQLDDLSKKNFIVLKIDNDADLSQK